MAFHCPQNALKKPRNFKIMPQWCPKLKIKIYAKWIKFERTL